MSELIKKKALFKPVSAEIWLLLDTFMTKNGAMKKFLLAAAMGSTLFTACNNGSTEQTAEKKEVSHPSITLADVNQSPEFPGATLKIKSVKATKSGNDSAKVAFEFDVKNYELKAQTSDGSAKGCNNSDKGQHIHFIIDNQPYKALYEAKNEATVANNTEHTVICFLSRSYHEALKNKEAFVLYHFKIDEKGNMQKLEEPTTPMLFYSRPKGDYLGKDTANILLDYYLANCTLSDTGYYVQANIKNADKGLDTTLALNTWKPYFIQNLGTGKCEATLTLINKKDNDKQIISVTRSFNLAAAEPVK